MSDVGALETALWAVTVVVFALVFREVAGANALVRRAEEADLLERAVKGGGARARQGATAAGEVSELERRLSLARIGLSPARWRLIRCGACAGAFVVAYLAGAVAGAPSAMAPVLLGVVCAVAVSVAFGAFLRGRMRRGVQLMERQLAQVELQLAENSRGGLSLGRSILACMEQADEPLRPQLARLYNEVTYADVSLADAFDHLAERTGSADARLLASVVRVQQQTGSSLADALSFLNETISRRIEMRQELSSSLAETKLTRNIVAVVPWGLFFLLSFGVFGALRMNGFWEFYSTNPLGWAVLAGCAVVEAVILAVMGRMADLKLD